MNTPHGRYPAGARECPLACIHELFAAQARRTPAAEAAVSGDVRLTYRELNRRSNRLAGHLRRMGVGPEVPVGLCLERSAAMIVGVLGVLKAGGAYVPLDPTYPRDRLAFMLEAAAAPVLLAQEPAASALPRHRARVLLLGPGGFARPGPGATGPGDDVDPPSGAVPDNLAYIIFTSGSTGRPKGTLLTHRGLPSLALLQARSYGIRRRTRTLQFASLSFDASVFEMFLTLCGGGALVLARPDEVKDPRALSDLLARERVTFTVMPPSVIAALPPDAGPALEVLAAAGEACPAPLAATWARRLHFVNAYGPNEATVSSTAFPVPAGVDEARPLPIGRPLPDVSIQILDDGLDPVPAGVTGEICIGGAGLARGYLDRPDLTAERFIPDPGGRVPGARLYRTGDLGRLLPGGDIEFLGRIDDQVKVRGFRIELGEVEAALHGHPHVRQAVVVAREDRGNRRLVAYVVPAAAPAAVPAADLREFLGRTLPAFMIPSAFVVLDGLPLTPSGKVDRRALPAPDLARLGLSTGYVAPRTPAERALAGLLAELFALDRVGVEDDFFELGGHSLLAMQVISRIRETLGVDLPLRAAFEARTVAALTVAVEAAAQAGGRREAPPILPASRDGPLPLSFAQKRLWFYDQYEPDSPLYNLPFAIHLCGALDGDALRRALGEVVRRHEALRTTFSNVHHIVFDGWSMGVFFSELTAIYEAFAAGAPPRLPELPVQYADFAEWQRQWLSGAVLDELLGYWRTKLCALPLLELPADRARPPAQTFRGATASFGVPADVSFRLKELGRRCGATPFMTLLAAFKALLGRYSGADDVVVGSVIANRDMGVIEGLIGFFVNTLVLRTDLSGDPPFEELVRRVRDVTLDAYAHRDMPFDQLVELLQPARDPSRSPLFQALFVLQNAHGAAAGLPGLTMTGTEVDTGTAKFDLMVQMWEAGDALTGSIEYNTDLYDAATIERMIGHFQTLLAGAAAAPDQRLSELPLPIGVPGEMYIGGAGLARGYLNRPDLTAETFIADPFGGEAGARLYKSGDLARYLPNGDVDFLGRVDTQVKIRGFRIELGEVEAALSRHPAVKQAVVVAREDAPGTKRLIAYLLCDAGAEPTVSEMRGFLGQGLPAYMVPAAFVMLSSFPMTGSGKVDHRALPVPEPERPALDQEFVAPRSPTEQVLADEVFAGVLGIEHVGVNDNFFELGGNSLQATQLISRVRTTFNVDIPLGAIFAAPTVAGLAQAVEAALRGGAAAADHVLAPITYDLEADAVLEDDLQPEGGPYEHRPAAARVLLTGATGFIGAFMLAELLAATKADVYCLIRAADAADGARRIRDNLASYMLWDDAYASRVVPVIGDLARARLGLSDADFGALATTIDAIYHCGARVNYVLPYPQLKPANVNGTREVIRLAMSGRPKPVNSMSSLAVFAPEGDAVRSIHEHDDPRLSAVPPVGYSQTKWVAERLLRAAGARGLPVCIYRLGRVWGHSQTGACQAVDFMWLMVKGCIQFGAMPDLPWAQNLIPVDYLAKAIVYLSLRRESLGKTFHMFHPVATRFKELTSYAVGLGYKMRTVSYEEWLDALKREAERSQDNALYPMLSGFGKLSAGSLTFECPATLDALAGAPFTYPALDSELLGRYFSYFMRTGFLGAPAGRVEA